MASAEKLRQIAKDDQMFVKSLLYFFELEVPGVATNTGTTVRFITPLLINPQNIVMQEPYAVTPTPTVGGGLYVEEDGVIARHLQISGTTGFQPRSAAGVGFGASIWQLDLSEDLSFPMRGETIGTGSVAPIAFMGMSGQRQFQFLQDRIFRLYSDLKQNPDASAGTKLYFHNPKDQENWRVIPMNFTMTRAAPRSTMYFYDIQLLVVEKANYNMVEVTQSPENLTFVDQIRNSAKAIRGTINSITGSIREFKNTIQQYSAALGEIKGAFNSFNNIIDECSAVAGELGRALDGVNSLVRLPFDTAINLVESLEETVKIAEGVKTSTLASFNFVDQVGKVERSIINLAATLGSEEAQRDQLNRYRQLTENLSVPDEGAGIQSATSIQGLANQGTGVTAGTADTDRGRPPSQDPMGRPSGNSVRTVRVNQNDSIQDIATRTLGSPARAAELIILNNLRPPYISDTGIPNTLKPGDELLVPSAGRNSADKQGPTVLGVNTASSLEARLYGIDMLINPVPSSETLSYDLVLSSTGEDIRHVSGVDNLKQGLRTRLLTELGSDPLYPSIGFRRIVGLNATGTEQAIMNLSLSDAVLADERVQSIEGLRVVQPTPDALVVEFNALVFNLQDRLQMTIVR